MNAYTNISGGGILPPSQNPDYDPNGNMLSGPVGTDAAILTYDKENRLRTLTQNGTTTGYTYDALSRCIESFNNTSPTDNRERYTWSGWTLLNRELFTGTTPTSSFRYTWGLDLSESLEGAGGVGGLLAIERIVGSNTDIRFPHYDANGNIIALTDSTGNVSARYRYDAFGKVLSATDLDSSNWVTHNIHGFSTKPTLGTPNLLYYGYRFYTPSTGRWINHDPIEESGGLNLYGFVGNSGVDHWDYLGMKKLRQIKIGFYGAGQPNGATYKALGKQNLGWPIKLDSRQGVKTFNSTSWFAARDWLLDELDENKDGEVKLKQDAKSPGDCPADVRIVGYSWGAWSALRLSQWMNTTKQIKSDGLRTVNKLGLLDTVDSWRPGKAIVPGNVVYSKEIYQLTGCKGGHVSIDGNDGNLGGCLKLFGLVSNYKGLPIAGVTDSRNVTGEGASRYAKIDVTGREKNTFPDHLDLGFFDWGTNGIGSGKASYAEEIAKLLD